MHATARIFCVAAALAVGCAAAQSPQYGYTSREPDASGLMHYRSRYLDPSTGRFTQRDRIGQLAGVNDYAYVGGNPVKAVDPWGLVAEDADWRIRAITNGMREVATQGPMLKDVVHPWTMVALKIFVHGPDFSHDINPDSMRLAICEVCSDLILQQMGMKDALPPLDHYWVEPTRYIYTIFARSTLGKLPLPESFTQGDINTRGGSKIGHELFHLEKYLGMGYLAYSAYRQQIQADLAHKANPMEAYFADPEEQEARGVEEKIFSFLVDLSVLRRRDKPLPLFEYDNTARKPSTP